jgi:cytochrome c553
MIIISVIFVFLGCSSGPIDAKALYTKDCSNCHGKFARKSAFGKSQIIAGFSQEEIKHAIKGYQDKTYGGSMKNLMRKQVSSLNDDEIDALANYIFSLNH